MGYDAATQVNSTRALMLRLVRESIRPYLIWIILALGCMAIVAAATATSAWLMKPVINEVFFEKNKALLWIISLAVFFTFTIKGIANYGQAVLMSYVGQRIITDTQHRLYSHLISLEVSFFNNTQTGNLISRFTIDINMMRTAVANALTGFGKDFLSLIGLVWVMFWQDWQLGLIAFIVFPIAVIPIVRIGKRMRAVTVNTQVEMGQFTTLLQQTFQGVRVVKSYGMEGYEKNRVKEIAERIFLLVFRSARIRSLASPIMESLGGIAITMVIAYGGHQVITENLDAGSFFSFITALLLAYEPMKRLANLNASLQEGLAGAQRLFEILDRSTYVEETKNPRNLKVYGGEIIFQNVEFSYDTATPTLLNINLRVPAGKTVALVGASGAGKSTILDLIPRFYDTKKGNILIDGTDIKLATIKSLRKSMALVSQEITLFDDTIEANIAYGLPNAPKKKIIEAAKNAGAHNFISDMPLGYNTLVGERGMKVSGGQRQRIAIARAMLKNAPILLLDEATSALDTESERFVQNALKKLMVGRTTLVIAHRLSTVIDADLIYVIDQGRILESGTHAQLVKKNGIYKDLYTLQFREKNKKLDEGIK